MENEELAKMILNVIVQIPQGKVASYGQIAKYAGLPKHARLVGRVLGNLTENHQIPWFRVINSQGKISLNKLDEKGMCIQTAKLMEEGIVVIAGKVDLKKYQWQP